MGGCSEAQWSKWDFITPLPLVCKYKALEKRILDMQTESLCVADGSTQRCPLPPPYLGQCFDTLDAPAVPVSLTSISSHRNPPFATKPLHGTKPHEQCQHTETRIDFLRTSPICHGPAALADSPVINCDTQATHTQANCRQPHKQD